MILVTGAEGLLGRKIMRLDKRAIGTYISKRPEILGIKNRMVELDIRNREMVFDILKEFHPNCVIHCAALTNVDYCEENQKEAYKVNVGGTRNIADACKEINSKLVYVSTDFVFDGEKGLYKENDKPCPISYYGFTKLEAEKNVKTLGNYVIARTSVIYGVNKKNFVLWVLESLKNEKTINVVTDQYNSPTYNTDLARALLMLSAKGDGIYHIAGSERISRYDFAIKIANIFGLDEALIEKTTSDKLNQKAKRPFDSSLDVSKVKKSFGISLSNVLNGLEKMKVEIEKGNE